MPFWRSILIPLWFWTFLALGALLFLLSPGNNCWQEAVVSIVSIPKIRWYQVILCASAIFCFYEWPTVMRSVYGPRDTSVPPAPLYFNSRFIAPCSSWYEYGLEGIYSVLLSALMLKWIRYQKACANHWRALAKDGGEGLSLLLEPARGRFLTQLFEEWIVCSILFASSYMFDTFYYWHEISSESGPLYVLQGLLEHVVWGVSWIIISLPFLGALKSWGQARSQAIASLHRTGGGITDEQQRLIDQSLPLNGWLVFAANAGAVALFFLSLLHAVR